MDRISPASPPVSARSRSLELVRLIGESLSKALDNADYSDLIRLVKDLRETCRPLNREGLIMLLPAVSQVLEGLSRPAVRPAPGVAAILKRALEKTREILEASGSRRRVSYGEVLALLNSLLERSPATGRPGINKTLCRTSALKPGPENPLPVLVVEDSRIVSRILGDKLANSGMFQPVTVGSLAQCREMLEDNPGFFFAAVLDLILPDAPEGEVVDLVTGRGVPALIITASLDREIRERILKAPVMDYVMKSGVAELDQVVASLERYWRNRHITVMVVEDSKPLRHSIRRLLELQGYRVLEAGDGEEALEILAHNPLTLVTITDYMIPRMDGLELTRMVRSRLGKKEMIIIGLSSAADPLLSVNFLKMGANDFLPKPFIKEEFFRRINQNVEFVEAIESLEQASARDHLTGLYNRRHFFQRAARMLRENLDGGGRVAMAIMDLDHFKRINDTYGHQAGDVTLERVSAMLREEFEERGLLARFGGEEFCLMLAGVEADQAQDSLDAFRANLECILLEYRGQDFGLTMSIGLAVRSTPGIDLETMVRAADAMVYQAKDRGRNRVEAQEMG